MMKFEIAFWSGIALAVVAPLLSDLNIVSSAAGIGLAFAGLGMTFVSMVTRNL